MPPGSKRKLGQRPLLLAFAGAADVRGGNRNYPAPG